MASSVATCVQGFQAAGLQASAAMFFEEVQHGLGLDLPTLMQVGGTMERFLTPGQQALKAGRKLLSYGT